MMERALRAHHRLRQAAQGLRQDDHRLPEHAVRARRVQDRGDHRARCSSTIASSAHVEGELDTVTASMAKYWLTDLQGKSSTAACNCSAATATWTNIRSRGMYRDARVHAHLCRHERDHEAADRAEFVGALDAPLGRTTHQSATHPHIMGGLRLSERSRPADARSP